MLVPVQSIVPTKQPVVQPLPTGVVIGIIAGCLIPLAAAVALLFVYLRLRKKDEQNENGFNSSTDDVNNDMSSSTGENRLPTETPKVKILSVEPPDKVPEYCIPTASRDDISTMTISQERITFTGQPGSSSTVAEGSFKANPNDEQLESVDPAMKKHLDLVQAMRQNNENCFTHELSSC
jgi:hypothetical protein